MGKMTVKRGPGMDRLEQITTTLPGLVGKVGFFDSAKYGNGTSIAYVAAIQEHGAASAGVPARPFMRPAIDENRGKWSALFANGAKAIAKGDVTPENVLEMVTMTAAADVRYQVSTIREPALSKVTLLARKFKKKHGPNSIKGKAQIVQFMHQVAADPDIDVSGVSDKPLNDTGALLAHITNIVEQA